MTPMGSTTLDAPAAARAGRAADRLGLDPDAVERLPFDLSALADEGAFVNVDAAGFGMLDRRLGWEALGVALPQGADLAFRPPRCGLIPDRYRLPLLRPPQRAHAALHRYSYRFTLTEALWETPAYRWVPWRAFPAFEREFAAAEAALAAAKSEAIDVYEAIREEVTDAFLQLADDSARRLAATGHPAPEGYREAVVRGVSEAIPTAADLRDRLTLRYRVGVVLLGSEMLEEQLRARETRRRVEEAEATLRLKRHRQEGRERLVQREFWAEEERLRLRLAAEEEDRRQEEAVKARLRQLKLDAARERLAEALSPLEEGARQLHSAVYEAATAIRASLQKHGALRGGSAKRARELARWFRLMNWGADGALEELVAELERLASQPAARRRRDPGPLDQVLGDIVERCYADARALAEPHRMGALEL